LILLYSLEAVFPATCNARGKVEKLFQKTDSALLLLHLQLFIYASNLVQSSQSKREWKPLITAFFLPVTLVLAVAIGFSPVACCSDLLHQSFLSLSSGDERCHCFLPLFSPLLLFSKELKFSLSPSRKGHFWQHAILVSLNILALNVVEEFLATEWHLQNDSLSLIFSQLKISLVYAERMLN